MATVAFHTLGCKVNQYETEKIAESFEARGFRQVAFSDKADVYIINTCTVTHTADSKSRQMARAAINRNPDAKVVLTGCYAETSGDELRGIDGIAAVIGNKDKASLVDKVVKLLPSEMESVLDGQIRNPKSEIRNTRTRALLKIQDGCDQFCTYCAVPLARSEMWSKPIKETIAEASNLANIGYKEIVLTGIRLGRYEDGSSDMCDLLSELSLTEGIDRIRLSSIELTDIPDGLPDLLVTNRKICRHLHIPLQSGDDAVLSRMNRPYTTEEFESFVLHVRKLVPGIGITTDIMTGFPGESIEEFENSYKFAEKIRFSRSHVFRYSRRARTAAAEMKDNVPAAEKERRSSMLMRLASEYAHEFSRELIGQTVSVLVEGKKIGPNVRSGLTDNYVRVALEASSSLVGEIVDVLVESVSEDVAHGRII